MRKVKEIELKELIIGKVITGCAITTDLWTDNYDKRTYITATLHFIHDSQLKELVLGLKSIWTANDLLLLIYWTQYENCGNIWHFQYGFGGRTFCNRQRCQHKISPYRVTVDSIAPTIY